MVWSVRLHTGKMYYLAITIIIVTGKGNRICHRKDVSRLAGLIGVYNSIMCSEVITSLLLLVWYHYYIWLSTGHTEWSTAGLETQQCLLLSVQEESTHLAIFACVHACVYVCVRVCVCVRECVCVCVCHMRTY